MFWMGWLGMPRRYASYPPDFQIYHILSSAGASILGVGYLMPVVYLAWSLRHGRKATANPWRATGLEWLTSSPPPKHNFKETPIVTAAPYDYYPDVEEKNLKEEREKEKRLQQLDPHAAEMQEQDLKRDY